MAVLKHYDWRRVAVVAGQHLEYFLDIREAFEALAKAENISVNASRTVADFLPVCSDASGESLMGKIIEETRHITRGQSNVLSLSIRTDPTAKGSLA